MNPGVLEWNKAFVDERWIILDTTFDAGGYNEEYFDPNPETFALTHKEYNESDTFVLVKKAQTEFQSVIENGGG